VSYKALNQFEIEMQVLLVEL